MRRALVCVLAAAVVVVAGWSAVTSQTAPLADLGHFSPQAAADLVVDSHPGDDGGAAESLSRGVVLGSADTPVALRSGALASTMLVQREGALLAVTLVVLAALLFLVGLRPTWFRTRGTGMSPRCAPPLRVAPRRGPPVGFARPSGS